MTELKEGDQAYAVNFEIVTCSMLPRMECFDAKEVHTDSFRSAKVYLSKIEAIDAVIEALTAMKECIDE